MTCFRHRDPLIVIRVVGIHTVCESRPAWAQPVEVHTVRKGVDTKAVYGIGSTPGYVTTQQANWGAARPFTSLHQYARYVPTFPDDARLGQGHCCSAGSGAHAKLVANLRCLFDLPRPCRGKPSSHQNMFRRYSRSSQYHHQYYDDPISLRAMLTQ